MLRWAVLLMKLVIRALVIWRTTRFVRDSYPSYIPGLPFPIEIWLSVVVIAFSACIFLLAVALINERNVFRVLVNWCIIAIFTSGCWLFGYLMSPTPETRFDQTDIWFVRNVCAIIGAPMGYVVCLMLQQWLTESVTDLEEDESESDQYVDMAHD